MILYLVTCPQLNLTIGEEFTSVASAKVWGFPEVLFLNVCPDMNCTRGKEFTSIASAEPGNFLSYYK